MDFFSSTHYSSSRRWFAPGFRAALRARPLYIFLRGEGEVPPGRSPGAVRPQRPVCAIPGVELSREFPAGRGGGDPLQRRERARPFPPPPALPRERALGAPMAAALGDGHRPRDTAERGQEFVRWQQLRAPAGMTCHGSRRCVSRRVSSLRCGGGSRANNVFSFTAETMAAQREWSPMVSSR